MSEIDEIGRQLETANARVASLEQARKEHPDYPSIAANLDSAQRIRKKLESQLYEAAAAMGAESGKPHTPTAPTS